MPLLSYTTQFSQLGLLTENYFRNYCALFALSFRGQREKKPNHFQEPHFHPSFSKQHDSVDPISSIQFCLNHPEELHSESMPRKNSVHPSYRIPPLRSVASFCHHLSSKWWKQKKINLLGILLHRELPEEQKVGFMKDNSTTNHKVLSHMQIKCIVKLPLTKLNSGFNRLFKKIIVPDAFFKLDLSIMPPHPVNYY